jgi:hypothetical protein
MLAICFKKNLGFRVCGRKKQSCLRQWWNQPQSLRSGGCAWGNNVNQDVWFHSGLFCFDNNYLQIYICSPPSYRTINRFFFEKILQKLRICLF